jgi:hypothetical protein
VKRKSIKGVSLRGRAAPPQPRARRLMPKTRKWLIAQLLKIVRDAGTLVGETSKQSGPLPYNARDRAHGFAHALERIEDLAQWMAEEAELPEPLKVRRVSSYPALRRALAAILRCAYDALWPLAYNKHCSWAAVKPALQEISEVTAQFHDLWPNEREGLSTRVGP